MRTTPGQHEHGLRLELISSSPHPQADPGSPVALGINESWSTPVSSPHPPEEAEPRSPWYEIRREEAEELLPPAAVILCAREEEARHMRGWLEGPVLHESKLAGQWRRSSGQLKGVSVRIDLVVCGVGATNAAAAAATACCIGECHGSPVAVFNVGRAVSHDSELYTGDVVVGTHTIGLDIESHADCRSPSPGLSPPSDEDPSTERHRSVRRVDTEHGLLAAARVAAAAQRVGVVVEGVVGSTEAWASPTSAYASAAAASRLCELVRQHNIQNDSHLDDIAVTDGEAHAAAVICRRWSVPYLTIKEVLAPNLTESSRRAAGGRAAEVAVRILRTYSPIELALRAANTSVGGASASDHSIGHAAAAALNSSTGGPSMYPHPGPDPLTPPVTAAVSRLLKPKPLKFEGGAAPQPLPPQSSGSADSDGYEEDVPSAHSTSTADGIAGGSGDEGGAQTRETITLRQQHQGGTGNTAGRGGSDSRQDGSTNGSGRSGAGAPRPSSAWRAMGSWSTAVVSVSVVAAALALGCGIGLYLAAAMPIPITMPVSLDSSAARAGAIAVCEK
eukprot:COSAG02_NODE_90_length_37755_cov_29.833364_18_plen_561_part_00